MLIPHNNHRLFVTFLLIALVLVACTSTSSPVQVKPEATPTPGEPDWFRVEMTDVRTGQPFTMSELAGKVVLLETMAQ